MSRHHVAPLRVVVELHYVAQAADYDVLQLFFHCEECDAWYSLSNAIHSFQQVLIHRNRWLVAILLTVQNLSNNGSLVVA
jgi:hypothetical protein